VVARPPFPDWVSRVTRGRVGLGNNPVRGCFVKLEKRGGEGERVCGETARVNTVIIPNNLENASWRFVV
jgi:hypothetical protein